MDLSGRQLGDYRLEHELGKGGMGTVYRAETSVDGPAGPAGSRVAVKIFHPEMVADERSFQRFEREAEIGKRIRHPHVVRTFDVGSDEVDGHPYYYMVMEVIEGQTLGDLQKDLGTVPESLLFQIADQALDALEEVHKLGVIHRDIKPENIVITPDHRVLLMDLGIAKLNEGGHTLTEAGEFVGSLFYAAPEQFMGAEGGLTGRCDLYAFGLVLYKLATGVNPYETMDLTEMLGSKLQHEPTSPVEHAKDLDPFWVDVILTCCRKDPAERFAGAGEVRAILKEGEQSEWWKARTADVAVPTALPALKRLRLQREVSLVGRNDELALLRAQYDRAVNEGRVLMLGGASGVGKSRLVYEFLEGLSAAGGPHVGAGRSVGRGGRSYHAFVEAFGDLLNVEGSTREQLEERVRPLLPNTPGMVEALAGFLVGDVTATPEKDALLAAFAELCRSLAAEKPLVLIVEDLQLAGPESQDLFAYLSRCVEGHSFLLLGVYTEEEVEEGTDLHEFITKASSEDGKETVLLEPLSPDATDELVGAVVMQPRTTSALAYPLYQRADGNPNAVLEMLAHLKTSGALAKADEGYQLVRPLDDETMPSSLQDLVNLRLGKLDDDQREIIEAAAILGYIFEASLLAKVLEVKKIKLLQRLAVLERKFHLLKSSGRNSFRFASHQLREAIYESITPSLRTEYHAVVADTILEELDDEEPEPPTAYALLRHLMLSEQALEAEPYLETALRYIRTNVHASVAAPFLEKLSEAYAIARPASRMSIAMRLWTAYEMLGQQSDAMRVLEDATTVADQLDEAGPKGQVLSCLAATHWLSGNLDQVEADGTKALELLREADDKLWIGNTLQTMGGLAYRRGKPPEAMERWEEALSLRREIGDRKGEVSSMLALAAVMPAVGRASESLQTKEAALAIAEEIGERRFEAALHNNIAQSLQMSQDLEGALEHLDEAVRIARELGDQNSEAIALGNSGEISATLGRIEHAKAALSRAIEVFREIDRPASEIVKRIRLASVLGSFGDRAAAQQQLHMATELAEKHRDQPALAAAQKTFGRLLHEWGKRDEGWERLKAALNIEQALGDDEGRSITLDMMGHAALVEKQFGKAAEYLEDSLQSTKAGWTSQTLLTQARLASARQGLGEDDVAKEHAGTVERQLTELGRISPETGPEIHYRLSELSEDEEARMSHLTVAENLLATRAGEIRSGGYKEHFLTQSGHNPEILEAARDAIEEDSD
ncbi:MAG: protein kinase [Planctomycetota bacterium]